MNIAEWLLPWYDAHARALPWRGIHDPYRTWVSETMLQQTRVETVLTYYPRFLSAFPDLPSLASAPEDAVMKQWEGLGYYRRARNLHRGAQQVVEDFGGCLPSTVPELMKIHGIGAYTAGAIASIAFEQPVPAVDGNVIRVMARLHGIRENAGIPSVRRRIEEAAAQAVPRQRPGDFNQALMDLGATVCTPGTPSCERCPLTALCDAYREGDAEALPELPQKRPPRMLNYDVCLIYDDAGSRVLVRQRTETMLGGLWVFPMLESWHTLPELPGAVRRKTGLRVEDVQPRGSARHVFTHQIWEMKLYAMQAVQQSAPEGWRFVTWTEMETLAMPTAMKKAVEVARKDIGCSEA